MQMVMMINNLWTTLLVVASTGTGWALADCDRLETYSESLSFTTVNNTNKYMVTCADTHLKLKPIMTSYEIHCEKNNWINGFTKDLMDMASLECVHMCVEPELLHGEYHMDDDQNPETYHMGPLSELYDGQLHYIPGVKINLRCESGYSLSSPIFDVKCGPGGLWTPEMPTCIDGVTTTKDVEETGVTIDPYTTLVVSVTVTVVAVVSCVVIMVTIAVRAKWRGVCRKRHAPSSHPDDVNYPHGYTQLDSGSLLPSYVEATEDNDDSYRDGTQLSGMYPVYRTTTTTADYRQLSSMESSSRGESESLSAGSHRHSLFSGSSANYRNVVGGDNISDILLQGDHLSMSDTSTLVTVNTYESNRTASNPSLSNSRRGVAGSMVSNTSTSMDDAPLIVRTSNDNRGDNRAHNNAET